MVSKKKSIPDEVINVYNDERLVSKHDKKQKANKPSGGWPKITQGSHLTVITYEDGRTELQWDDEQLLKEVREAIASVEKNVKPAVKAKANKKVPEAMTRAPAKKTPAKKAVAKKTTKGKTK